MEEFKRFVLTCTADEISKKRHALLQDINGDVFYPISLWPKKMERLSGGNGYAMTKLSSCFSSW